MLIYFESDWPSLKINIAMVFQSSTVTRYICWQSMNSIFFSTLPMTLNEPLAMFASSKRSFFFRFKLVKYTIMKLLVTYYLQLVVTAHEY